MMIIKTAIMLSAAGLALMYAFLLVANMLIRHWEKQYAGKSREREFGDDDNQDRNR